MRWPLSKAVIQGTKGGLDLQTIEKALRVAKRSTYLIALDPEPYFHEDHIQPRLPGDTQKQKYWLYFSNDPDALKKLFKESTSYEENFAKLKETGFATQISSAPLKKGVKKLPE